MRQHALLVLVAVALPVSAACRGERVPNGAWGGGQALLTVSDNGGRAEFDCGHGSLDHPLRLDDEGRFSVPGTYVPENAPGGDAAQRRPARYAGRLERDRVTFTVTVEGQASRGPFTVALARPAKLDKCGHGGAPAE